MAEDNFSRQAYMQQLYDNKAQLAQYQEQLRLQRLIAENQMRNENVRQQLPDIVANQTPRLSSSLMSDNVYSPYLAKSIGGYNFQPMLQAIDNEQNDFDNNFQQYVGLMRNIPALEQDVKRKNEALKKYRIDPAIVDDKFATQKIKQIARNFIQDVGSNQSEIGAIANNYNQFMQYKKQIEENKDLTAEQKEKLVRASHAKYKGIGNDQNDITKYYNQFGGINAAKPIDNIKIVNDAVQNWASDKYKQDFGSVGLSSDGNWVVKNKQGQEVERIPFNEVRGQVMTALKNNAGYSDFNRQMGELQAWTQNPDELRKQHATDLQRSAEAITNAIESKRQELNGANPQKKLNIQQEIKVLEQSLSNIDKRAEAISNLDDDQFRNYMAENYFNDRILEDATFGATKTAKTHESYWSDADWKENGFALERYKQEYADGIAQRNKNVLMPHDYSGTAIQLGETQNVNVDDFEGKSDKSLSDKIGSGLYSTLGSTLGLPFNLIEAGTSYYDNHKEKEMFNQAFGYTKTGDSYKDKSGNIISKDEYENKLSQFKNADKHTRAWQVLSATPVGEALAKQLLPSISNLSQKEKQNKIDEFVKAYNNYNNKVLTGVKPDVSLYTYENSELKKQEYTRKDDKGNTQFSSAFLNTVFKKPDGTEVTGQQLIKDEGLDAKDFIVSGTAQGERGLFDEIKVGDKVFYSTGTNQQKQIAKPFSELETKVFQNPNKTYNSKELGGDYLAKIGMISFNPNGEIQAPDFDMNVKFDKKGNPNLEATAKNDIVIKLDNVKISDDIAGRNVIQIDGKKMLRFSAGETIPYSILKEAIRQSVPLNTAADFNNVAQQSNYIGQPNDQFKVKK